MKYVIWAAIVAALLALTGCDISEVAPPHDPTRRCGHHLGGVHALRPRVPVPGRAPRGIGVLPLCRLRSA